MKTVKASFSMLIVALVFTASTAMAQKVSETKMSSSKHVPDMKTFVIEREIPNAGKLTPEELKAISQKSCAVLREMGPQIQWQQSYVTGNKIYCVYKAESAELITEHAKKGGFPANSIAEVASTISPATAN